MLAYAPSGAFVTYDVARGFVEETLLAAGLQTGSAVAAAEGLALASLRGVDSHGIQLLPHYIAAIRTGRINTSPRFEFERTSTSTGTLDADHAIGFAAGNEAVRRCEALAAETGVGVVSVRNSTHGGMLAYYILPPARRGGFALAMTATTPKLVPPGATRPFLGTNPMAYAVPLATEDPLCYDAATTQITSNTVRLYRDLGRRLPADVATDAHGRSTRSPDQAEFLHPFGGYKGFGIALLVDILCSGLAGMPSGDRITAMYGDLAAKRRLGQFFAVFDISRFIETRNFTTALQDEVDRLRALPAIDEAHPVIVPGDPEKRAQHEREKTGIPLPTKLLEAVDRAACSVKSRPLSAHIR